MIAFGQALETNAYSRRRSSRGTAMDAALGDSMQGIPLRPPLTHVAVKLATISLTVLDAFERELRDRATSVAIGHLVCATADLVVKSCSMKADYLYPSQDAKALVDKSRRAVLRTFDGFGEIHLGKP
jgi:hypothetical protein